MPSEFGLNFGSNFTSAFCSTFRNLYGFSFRKTEALGSDGKSLTSFFKDESTVWDTLGVQIIGMSTFTDMEHSEFSGRQIFRPKCASPPAKLCGVV